MTKRFRWGLTPSLPRKGVCTLCQTLLRDPSFHDFLDHADRDLAATVRRKGCPSCCGVLHSGNYLRKPRGGLWPKSMRLSFCCAREGCRKRCTPATLCSGSEWLNNTKADWIMTRMQAAAGPPWSPGATPPRSRPFRQRALGRIPRILWYHRGRDLPLSQ